MKIHLLRFKNGNEFLSCYEQMEGDGGLVFPTRAALKPGETFVIEVKFPPLPNRVLVKATVSRAQKASPDGPGQKSYPLQKSHPLGTIVARFLRTEKPKRDFLLEMAKIGHHDSNGKLKRPAHRRYRRFPVDMGLTWQVKETELRHQGRVEDLSSGGMFVRTEWTPPVGTELKLTLQPDDAKGPLGLYGRVTWVSQGLRAGGMGIRFQHNSRGEMRRIRRLIRHISNSGEFTHQTEKNGVARSRARSHSSNPFPN